MNAPNYVFILGGQEPIVLHPFDSSAVFKANDPGDIAGRYGAGDVPRNADLIRTGLYAAMEKGSRSYFLNKGYYLRLALTTATFVVVYLFFSIVIRDPVPILDELALSLVLSAVVFFTSERLALSSTGHIDLMLKLRRSIDGAYFAESRIVDLLEAWRDEALALGPAAFYKSDAIPVALSGEETEEALALCGMLAERWKSKPIVSELYAATKKGTVPGALLDKTVRRLGNAEGALAIAYMRLIPLALTEQKR